MNQYIPDLTERFPEGFGGVDLTENYFWDRGALYEREMDMFFCELEREIEDD